HGVRDARAKGRGEHLPLERTQGANSLGGAPNSFLPQGASACLGSGVQGPRRRVPTYNNGSNSYLDSDGKRAVVFMPVRREFLLMPRLVSDVSDTARDNGCAPQKPHPSG